MIVTVDFGLTCARVCYQVEVSFTTTVTDRLLTGVQFSQRNASSSDVMTCAYDSHSISVWHNE